MTSTAAFLAAGLALFSQAAAQNVRSLSGDDWTVTNPSLNVSIPGSFPSQAHLDLYAAQVIGDPYYGLNDFNLRWVAWSNWTYISPPITGLSYNDTATWLLFQGLDTFTSIELCGQHVAATNNQFRQYYFDVSSILSNCTETPVLSINFGSAPNIVDDIAAQPGQETWPEGVQQLYEFPNRWFMRKEQSDFGWDWGPAFAPAGPWLPGYVIQLAPSELYVRNALVDIYRLGQLNNMPPDQSQPWVVNASVDVLGSLPSDAKMSYVLCDSSGKTVANGSLTNVNATSNTISGYVMVPDGMVDLWWPVDMGAQTLYNMTIEVTDASGKTITSAQRRVGFRTIVLNEGVITNEQLAQGIAPGNNWHFEINGHEFFAKGSNFIPPDAFWPRVTEERIQQLFQSVVDGRQNMLRVWSSGAYSPDFLYDIADELGILLWSEFEFGDALYPVDHEFLDNVADEINYQVRRINHHPSLAFWAGGNELENLELSNVNASAPNEYLYYKGQYEELFLNTIVPIVFGNTRSISYAPSSTSNGYINLSYTEPPYFTERYENLVPGSIYGETDYYNYNSTEAFNTSGYPIGRFSNEFGFHSMPSLQTWQQAISPKDLYFNSSVIRLRNHHFPPGGLNISNFEPSDEGMGEMTEAVQQWYPTPMKTNSVANFSAWCHQTQIFQADYYRSQIQFYRRGSGQRQRTLGSLYWQLEDIWQAPTWAGIEYDGRWKVLHYGAKDIYSNVIVAPAYDVGLQLFEIDVTSDLWDDAKGTVSATWYDWSGNKLNVSALSNQPVQIGALNSTSVYRANLTNTLSGYRPENVVMQMSVNVTGNLPNNKTSQTFTHSNWFHWSPLSTARLVDPGLTIDYDPSTRLFTVEATKGIAAWVWIDYPLGAVVTFDANGFWLAKGEKKTVGYTIKTDSTGGSWVKGVTVQSIYNSTLPM